MQHPLIIAFVLASIALAQDKTQIETRLAKAREYEAKGFHPIDCLAGQVSVRGQRISRQPFALLRPNAEMKCCGEGVTVGHTDAHGHFLVEPLSEGEYFARFTNKGVEYTMSFGVMQDYSRCGPAYVELNFSAPDRYTLQSYVAVDYDEKDCAEDQAACYRK